MPKKKTTTMYHVRVFFKKKSDAVEVANLLKMLNRNAVSNVVYDKKLELYGVEVVADSRDKVKMSIEILRDSKWITKVQSAKLIKQVRALGIEVKRVRKKPYKRVGIVKKFIKVKK